jgi:hypothetical protein
MCLPLCIRRQQRGCDFESCPGKGLCSAGRMPGQYRDNMLNKAFIKKAKNRLQIL